jgi:hypothetical protein
MIQILMTQLTPPQLPMQPASPDSVRYWTPPRAFWRCHLRSYLTRPGLWMIRIAGSTLIGLMNMNNPEIFTHTARSTVFLWTFAITLFLQMAGMIVVYCVKYMNTYHWGDGPQVCTTAITPDGMRDGVSAAATKHFPWTSVRSVKSYGGDLYIRTLQGGCFIPRESFPSAAENERFFQSLLAAWNRYRK